MIIDVFVVVVLVFVLVAVVDDFDPSIASVCFLTAKLMKEFVLHFLAQTISFVAALISSHLLSSSLIFLVCPPLLHLVFFSIPSSLPLPLPPSSLLQSSSSTILAFSSSISFLPLFYFLLVSHPSPLSSTPSSTSLLLPLLLPLP